MEVKLKEVEFIDDLKMPIYLKVIAKFSIDLFWDCWSLDAWSNYLLGNVNFFFNYTANNNKEK